MNKQDGTDVKQTVKVSVINGTVSRKQLLVVPILFVQRAGFTGSILYQKLENAHCVTVITLAVSSILRIYWCAPVIPQALETRQRANAREHVSPRANDLENNIIPSIRIAIRSKK